MVACVCNRHLPTHGGGSIKEGSANSRKQDRGYSLGHQTISKSFPMVYRLYGIVGPASTEEQ